MIKFADLNRLDLVSVLIAAISHDYGHDGLNNAYHVNAISDRAIRYSDQSVQENWHAAESFSILMDKKFNFLEGFSNDDFKTFRKRMVGIILSTDMAKHVNDLASFNAILEKNSISNGKNQEKIINRESAKTLFDSQQ
eukprot:CAMPEP_0116877028 /NCGR_PEP_ID=MMETSP0463-20121206/8865_1 /TAXON_ID=181622 /ORGANISM="Strombidinopsis sp, Strain SopsisLIS2011" /LENGTH=137 /DNA_ID=CAMNT_0004524013 /DNA_START=892 /DNA_END=1305 /DNA_ORIENTATION=+